MVVGTGTEVAVEAVEDVVPLREQEERITPRTVAVEEPRNVRRVIQDGSPIIGSRIVIDVGQVVGKSVAAWGLWRHCDPTGVRRPATDQPCHLFGVASRLTHVREIRTGEDPRAAPSSGWTELSRRVAIGGISGVVGGVLVIGVGGRLAMRLSGFAASLSNDRAFLLSTEDGFRVGRITLDGSIGFVIFGGIFGGLMAAVLWVLIKDWLPQRGRLLWAGLMAAAVGGNQFVTPDNIDFVILEPVVMNVILYPALCGLAGVVIATIDGRLSRWHARSVTAEKVVFLLISLLGAQVFVGAVAAVIADGWLAVAVALPLVVAFMVAGWQAARSQSVPGWWPRLGLAATALVGLASWVRLLLTSFEILA